MMYPQHRGHSKRINGSTHAGPTLGIGFSTLLLRHVLFTLITMGRKGASWVVSPSTAIHFAPLDNKLLLKRVIRRYGLKKNVSCKDLALQPVIQKGKKGKGQIKWKIACITWMTKPSTCAWVCDFLMFCSAEWTIFLSASFISPLERDVSADDCKMHF